MSGDSLVAATDDVSCVDEESVWVATVAVMALMGRHIIRPV